MDPAAFFLLPVAERDEPRRKISDAAGARLIVGETEKSRKWRLRERALRNVEQGVDRACQRESLPLA